MYTIPVITLLLSALTSTIENPIVSLPYANYRGFNDQTNNVSQWLGMRYAAPPTGNLRFAAPQDPPRASGIQDATKHKPFCLGVNQQPPFPSSTSEDCLYLDVFAPSNATNTSALPVFVFIQGGGFASNANANYNGRGLVAASGHKIVVVTFNYRVGPYGFISGPDIKSPNNGLKDQRKALEWVQRHIAQFGGDPKHVTLGGDSAGGASVSLHLTAYGGRNDNLFHAAAAESPSFATMLTVKESEYLYNNLARKTGCVNSRVGTFACLRSLPTRRLQANAGPIPYPVSTPNRPPLYAWTPVIDGDLIQDHTYRAFNSGKLIDVPTIFGDDTNGGTVFVPRNTNSLSESNQFLRDQFPYLTTSQIDTLNKLYPKPDVNFPNSGSYWRQASNVYGEMRYMCPALFISTAYATRKAAPYHYRYNVQDPPQMQSGVGVPHTVEVNALFGVGNVGSGNVPASYLPGGVNADIIPVMQGYWTSFIRTYNPNTHRFPGSATWEQFNAKDMNRFLFDTPVSSSKMESVDDGLGGRCEYLWSIGAAVKQ